MSTPHDLPDAHADSVDPVTLPATVLVSLLWGEGAHLRSMHTNAGVCTPLCLSLFFPQATQQRSKKPRRECGICRKTLPSAHKKALCQPCTERIISEETPSLFDNLRLMIREEVNQAVDQKIKSASPMPSTSRATLKRAREASPEVSSDSDKEEEGELASPTDSDSAEEGPGRSLCLPEETDFLLKAVRSTMGIEDPKEALSIQDQMFQGLDSRKKRVFPIHSSIKKVIKSEWARPDKRFFLSRSFKKKYPFSEEDSSQWDRVPKVDAPVTRISKKTSLPFEDMGLLKDPMDKKAEVLLKKSWESSTALFRPAIAATCTARSLKVWMEQLEEHLRAKTPRDQILASIPTLKKAADFLADASADTVRLAAKTAGLANATRRTVWLRSWSGDASSKSRLCGVPCEGERLFGKELDDILEKASDKKGFPVTQKPHQKSRSFRGFRKNWGQSRFPPKKSEASGRWQPSNKKGRGCLFNPNSSNPKSSQ